MPVAHARNGQCKADEIFAVERSDHVSADFVRNHEQTDRDQVGVRECPDFFLQGETRLHLLQRLAFADRHRGVHGWGSCCFACCQSSSSSSLDACAGPRPFARSRSSIHWKRRLNLRFVFRKADSGSSDR